MTEGGEHVIIFGLRGSNEPGQGNRGMGRTVATIAARLVDELERAVPATRCDLIGIPYPAARAHWSLFTGSMRWSIEQGRGLLVSAIDEITRSHLDSTVVIIGLSQGAASAHLALSDLLARKSADGKPLDRRVAAVLLYADPLRLAASRCNRPPNPPLDGALTWLWRMRMPIPQEFSDRVASFCDAQGERVDPICAFRPRMRTVATVYGNLIHTTYHAEERQSGWDGARFAAERVLARITAAP